MSKRGALSYQVTMALNQAFVPGESRHAAKAAGQTENQIYAINTVRNYVSDNVRFARWAKNRYGIRDIRRLKAWHARAYLDYLVDRERSGGYLGRVRSAIRKLSVALHGQAWNLDGGWHSDPRPDRVYTPEDARRIMEHLHAHARDKQVADVVQLQCVAGLRRREAVMLRGQDVDVERCLIRVRRGAKGGRPRDVPVDPEYRELLRRMQEHAARHGDGHVFQGRGSLGRRTERAVDEAVQRLGIRDYGTHGFRRLFAQERYRQQCDRGVGDELAREALTRDLGHGRRSVLRHYLEPG